MKKRIYSIATLLATAVLICSTYISPACAQQTADWTIMVFLNGDNNLEEFAVEDFEEMARIGSLDSTDNLHRPRVNIIVQFDRIKPALMQGESDTTDTRYGDWGQTLRFRITKGMEPTTANALQDLGEVDMGDGRTLENFVRWSRATYPAQRYMLIIWDHGQGWRVLNLLEAMRQAVLPNPGKAQPPAGKGLNRRTARLPRTETRSGRQEQQLSTFNLLLRQAEDQQTALSSANITDPFRSISSDDTSGGSILFNREVQDTLLAVLNGQRLAVIGFDACLMSMVETGYAMRNVASVMVGSEELEPGPGWQYDDWLTALVANPSMDGATLASAIVDSYARRYPLEPGTTLSAIDLSRMDALADSITAFADDLATAISPPPGHTSELPLVKAARARCKIYAPTYNRFHHIDLGRFCDQIIAQSVSDNLLTRAHAVRRAHDACVIRNYSHSSRNDAAGYGSNGLAIYFPASKSIYEADSNRSAYRDANTVFPVEFVQRHKWDNFLHEYYKKVP